MERTAQPQRLADACTCLSLTHGEPDTCMPGMLLKSSLYLLQMQMQLVMLNRDIQVLCNCPQIDDPFHRMGFSIRSDDPFILLHGSLMFKDLAQQ